MISSQLKVFIPFLISLNSIHLFSQDISSQHAKFIVELETVQSPITNTFISCSMKRTGHLITNNDQVLIHRSTNETASWTLIETLYPDVNGRLIDPVITVDNVGNYYIVLMRIEDNTVPIHERSTHLDVYRSGDDGISWENLGSAYSDIFPDYPQIISRGNGELFLTFGNYISAWTINTMFIKSNDGGETWSAPISFYYPMDETTNNGIPNLSWGQDSIIQLTFGSYEYKGPCYTESSDLGETWTDYLFANQGSTSAERTVLGKVISNPLINYYGILSHQPHSSHAVITYHYKNNDELQTTLIGEGGYAEGVMTEDSIIHIVYNEIKNDTIYNLIYVASNNQGITFTEPMVLYSAPLEIEEFGEYQSLIQGADTNFYLTFCDWADSSLAKTIVFEPLALTYNPILNTAEHKTSKIGNYTIYPNPSNGLITVEYPKEMELTKIIITNTMGRTIQAMQVESNFNDELIIDFTDQPNGNYLIRFQEKNRYIIKQIIKQ